jgi:serine/threonine protein kinase
MSPEVISGVNTEILPSIDVWSLGCLLYEMLTGKFLFDGSNRNEIKVKF